MPRNPKKLGDINLSTLLTLTNIAILILGLIIINFIFYAIVIILEILLSTPDYALVASRETFILHKLIMLSVLITWILFYGRD